MLYDETNTRNLFILRLNLSNLSLITNNFSLTYINLNIAYPQKINKRHKEQQESEYTWEHYILEDP